MTAAHFSSNAAISSHCDLLLLRQKLKPASVFSQSH